MKDFSELDAAILEHIRKGASPHPLYARRLNDLAAPLATATLRFAAGRSNAGDPDSYRVIDRRLQALRKSGLIRPDRKSPCGWQATGRLAEDGAQ